mgnify:CR=1 FL=1
MPVSSQWFAASGADPFDTTLIGNSVWLDGSADYLTKTWGSAGNRTRWTLAWWFQLNAIATDMTFFSANDGTSDFYIRMDGTSNQNMTIVDNNASMNVNTTAMQRDTAWYHCIISYDSNEGAEADRISIYINGVAMALTTAGDAYPSSGGETYWNNNQANEIGRRSRTTSSYANAYMTQICFLDGQSIQNSDVAVADFLDTQTFGDNGSQKIPKADADIAALATTAAGNSFCLDFASSSALGNDISDEENDFTLSSIAAANQSTNTPSLAYPIMSTISFGEQPPASMALTLGNNLMTYSGGDTVSYGYFSSQAILSTDNPIYFEYYVKGGSVGGTSGRLGAGLFEQIFDQSVGGYYGAGGESAYFYRGALYDDGTDVISSDPFTTAAVGEIQNMAYKPSTGEVWIGVEGTWRNGAAADSTTLNIDSPDHTITASKDYFIGMGANRAADIGVINFGNNGTFSGNETAGGEADGNGHGDFMQAVPSGFYALNSANRVAPTYQGIDYFNPVLYAGNGTAIGSGGKAVTGTGFQPDLVWIKNRDAADSHGIYDAVRGTTKQIESDTTTAETTESEGLTAFGSDGFTVGNLDQVNTSSENFVAWQWLGANGTSTNEVGTLTSTVSVAEADHFSIVSYTGSGSNTTVGHGLGAAPEMVIIRELPGGDDWNVYHADAASSPGGGSLRLDSTVAFVADATLYNSTVPSSTVISLGTSAETNQSSTAMIAYCFRSVAGVCKVGGYTGNGAADGPFIFTGFKPKYIIWKNADVARDWGIIDTATQTFNPGTLSSVLFANLNSADGDGTQGASGTAYDIDILAGGFKIRVGDSGPNGSGNTILYMAMADIGGGGTLPPVYGR